MSFFTPPVGPLIAAMVSTYGIYLAASFLYVCISLCDVDSDGTLT